jgi:hypothetical protein
MLKKPPRLVLQRLRAEFQIEAGRFWAPLRVRRLRESTLLGLLQATDLDTLWSRLAQRPYFARTRREDVRSHDALFPGARERILSAAEQALQHRIDLLGSGPTALGPDIDWSCDFKTGVRWRNGYALRLEYNLPASPCDVKVPWELSRLQWLLPAGQAYLLTGDERYAVAVREILDHWIESNPYAFSINWGVTMEVALRIVSWTWLFRVFCDSGAFADRAFRYRFLRTLYLHGEFTERFLERSPVNGNHFTADAAALVVAGLFFGDGQAPRRWLSGGWQLLSDEIMRQVSPDGVDFEGSLAYHHLVHELFLLPAVYRRCAGLPVQAEYRDALVGMARFVASYSRPDGTVPLLGDADDGRALPLGPVGVIDHRYLVGIAGATLDSRELCESFTGDSSQVYWWLREYDPRETADEAVEPAKSAAFPHGGYFVMRNSVDHVFIDCAPIGTAGKGGHGHNDCLSFEAALERQHLVSDCGAFVYTASYEQRNRFRSTAFHNTPRINRQEVNRFVDWSDLWSLQNDAIPKVLRWRAGSEIDLFEGSHSGYERLSPPIVPLRTFVLDHEQHSLLIYDQFISQARLLDIEVPLHLAVGVTVLSGGVSSLALQTPNGRRFELSWSASEPWSLEIGEGRISPSYGVAHTCVRLCWRYRGPGTTELWVGLRPEAAAAVELRAWADESLRRARQTAQRES